MVTKTIKAKIVRPDIKKPQQLSKALSLLPNDYRNLINLPQINGVEITGNLSAKQLNLLTGNARDYSEVALSDSNTEYFVVVGEDASAAKMPIKEVANALSIIKTADKLEEDIPVGFYRFVEKKKE